MRTITSGLVLFLIACGSNEGNPNPLPTPSSSSSSSGTSTSRPVYDGPSPLTIGSDAVTVTLRLDAFGMQIAQADGKVVLDTRDETVSIPDDATNAFGALGATRRSHYFSAAIIAGWDNIKSDDEPWLHGAKVASVSTTGASAAIDLFDPAEPDVTFHVVIDVDGAEVRVEATAEAPQHGGEGGATPGELDLFGQSFVFPEDEHVFGLGERTVTVDHRGRKFECWVEEGGIPLGEDAKPGPTNPFPNGPGMTHIPVPFYVSSKGYGLYVESTYRSGFSFGAEDTRSSRIYVEGNKLKYRVFVHADPKDTIAHYTAVTGRPHLPPAWAFGPRRRTDHYMNLGPLIGGVPEVQALREQKVPTTMVDDTTHFLPVGSNVGRETDLANWVPFVKSLGYKAIAYFNPYIATEDDRVKDLLEEGRKHGYFLKTDDGKEFITTVISSGPHLVSTIDVTNPGAVTFYRSIIKRALDYGYDGWMLDFGEYIPTNVVMHDGRTGWEAHNAFLVDYPRVVAEYLREVRGNDFMFYARAGFAGTQAWAPFVWSGDPAASYDDAKGLPAQVRSGVNAGISGFPFWGSDISGYSCFADPPADKELYIRWAQFGAFSPDMHDDNACAQKPDSAPPKWTLWSDAETTAIYGKYALLHTRMIPYLYAAAQDAAATGLPIMRHPFLVHPEEPRSFGIDLEYYFGPALYVAPIVRRDETARKLWLPPGTWFDWWTFAPVEGNRDIVKKAALDIMPLYLRSGGIVAMLDASVETLAPSVPGVVAADDVRDVLDVRAAIDKKTRVGHARIDNGTVLSVELEQGAIAIPGGITLAASEDELVSCELCALIESTGKGSKRIRVSGELTGEETLKLGALTLDHAGVEHVRVRWDVLVPE